MISRTPQKQDKFIIRLPDGMRDQISEAARANSRTMTAEIVARLRMSFEMGLSPTVEGELSEHLETRLRQIEERLWTMEQARR